MASQDLYRYHASLGPYGNNTFCEVLNRLNYKAFGSQIGAKLILYEEGEENENKSLF